MSLTADDIVQITRLAHAYNPAVDGHDAASLSGTRHCTIKEVIDGDGDRATMRSSYVVLGTEEASGGYLAELARIDRRWRFSCRVHTDNASFPADSLTGRGRP